jgi:hypothetical protein
MIFDVPRIMIQCDDCTRDHEYNYKEDAEDDGWELNDDGEFCETCWEKREDAEDA